MRWLCKLIGHTWNGTMWHVLTVGGYRCARCDAPVYVGKLPDPPTRSGRND